MGRLSATLLLLLGACGDNVDGDGLKPGPNDDINPDGNSLDDSPRYSAAVCGISSWKTESARNVNLSVHQTHDGNATFLTAPLTGGTLTGFNVDTRADIMEASETKVPIDGSFTNVSLSFVQNIPVATVISGTSIGIHQLDANFEYANQITTVKGSHVAEPTFFTANSALVMPVGGENGLEVYRFQDSLEPIDSRLFVQTAPATSFAATQLGSGFLSAWSTDTSCYLHMAQSFEPGHTGVVASPCPNPTLAYNTITNNGVMLFDGDDGVRLMTVSGTKIEGATQLLRADASSARTLFDGSNIWIAYIDRHGDIVAGFLDANHKPVTIPLGTMDPAREAFELTLVDGEPYVFSLDSSGYTAYHLCRDWD